MVLYYLLQIWYGAGSCTFSLKLFYTTHSNRFDYSAKYPLAVVSALLDAFGPDLGGGYDIGCKFASTLKRSSLSQLVLANNYSSLVGALHGHAHNRLCQLLYLAIYVTGLGLEDLEGCERFFSRSNALAKSARHSSIFHRRQSITEFLKYMDTHETYSALSK
jgi:hypothetical protein